MGKILNYPSQATELISDGCVVGIDSSASHTQTIRTQRLPRDPHHGEPVKSKKMASQLCDPHHVGNQSEAAKYSSPV